MGSRDECGKDVETKTKAFVVSLLIYVDESSRD